MEKIRKYPNAKFPPEILQKALDELKSILREEQVKADHRMEVRGEERRYKIGEETTFFRYYESDFKWASYKPMFDSGHLQVYAKWFLSPPVSEVSVSLPEESQIDRVLRIFEDAVATSWKSQVTVFIGHGRSPQWEALRDHLDKVPDLKVEAYETGARAGFTTKEILEEILEESSFALLVMTGEDIDAKGELHARENVTHEVGLFQGKLGFRRAIVLLEEDTKEFSNIRGIKQIRFKKASIEETFEEVLATLGREFGLKINSKSIRNDQRVILPTPD